MVEYEMFNHAIPINSASNTIQIRSYALEQAIGYNIDYEPTQMH